MIELSNADIRSLQKLIHNISGIYLNQRQCERLKQHISTYISSNNFKNFQQYYRILKTEEKHDEQIHTRELLSFATNNETYFFRNTAHFDALANVILPELVRRKTNPNLRIWSAGCSIGPEPYSIAITMSQNAPLLKNWNLEILATDIDYQSLNQAKDGLYNKRSLQNTPEHLLHKYFQQIGSGYQIDNEIKNLVNFTYSNLQQTPYPRSKFGQWDIIFCRNVIIYFSEEQKRKVIKHLHRSLASGGYLFLGHSESMLGLSDSFMVTNCAGTHLYQKNDVSPIHQQTTKPKQTEAKIRSTKSYGAHNWPETLNSSDLTMDRKETREGDKQPISGNLPPNIDIENLIAKGKLFADKGEYQSAANHYQKVIDIDYHNAEVHFLLASVLEQLDSLDEAIYEYKQTISFDPTCIMARLNLGRIYSSAGDREKAREEYKIALSKLQVLPPTYDVQYSGGFSAELLTKLCYKKLEQFPTM